MTIESECDYVLCSDSDSESTDKQPPPNRQNELFKKLGSAVFYGVASFLLTVVNKTVLTTWKFPSFMVVSIGQLAASIIVLYVAREMRIVSFPKFSRDVPWKMMPLPFLHFGNMAFGLGGTQALSLPMFTAIRRVSILLTMILEFRILGMRPSRAVQISVWSMIAGAVLAAVDDLSFSASGYTYVMIANLITALYGVFIKQKLDTVDFGKYGIMFYNSLLMIGPAVFLAWFMGDLQLAFDYPHWFNPLFTVQFLMSCCMGFALTYSTFMCTEYNSALTTAMVGCVKNVFVSYLGMFIGGDYVFSWLNCIGINVSILGSVYYTYAVFGKKDSPRKPTPQDMTKV